MNATDIPDDDSPAVPPTVGSSPEPTESASAPLAEPARSAKRCWTFVLAAGFLAGLSGWGLGELGHGAFDVRLNADSRTEGTEEALQNAQQQNVMLVLGLYGVTLGGFFGLAGGAIRRSLLWGTFAATAGAVLGGLAGVGVAWGLVPVFSKHVHLDSNDLLLPILLHAGMWAALGLTSGLAFGVGIGGGGKRLGVAILGGILGAVLGGVLFDVLGAIVFPLDRTSHPISITAVSRLAARMMIALGIAVGLVLAVQPSPRQRVST